MLTKRKIGQKGEFNMSEQYSEYRRRDRHQKNKPKGLSYSKKFKYQLILSTICLSVIYLIQASDSSFANIVNDQIKSAFTYEVDTTAFKNLLGDIFKIKIEDGE